MALYKNPGYFTQDTGNAFDVLHTPGDRAPYSGLYRCETCGDEIAHNGGNPLPPQNHHQHAYGLGAIKWRLIAASQQRK